MSIRKYTLINTKFLCFLYFFQKVALALFLAVCGMVASKPVELLVEEGRVEKVDRARFLLPDCTSVLASSLPECQQVNII
jgi:hypothetical protein